MKKKFTLIELLVVLGIMGLLVAMIFPIYIESKANGRKVTCASNLRQMNMTLQMYISDNDGYLPSIDAWRLQHVFKSKQEADNLKCPSAKNINVFDRQGVPGYAFNSAMIGKINHEIVVPGYDAYTAESVTKVTFPTNTVMFCEQAIGVPFSIGPDPNHFTTIRTPEGEEKGWLRHNNGANYLFCDGHVKWYSPDAVGYNITGTNDGVKPTFAL